MHFDVITLFPELVNAVVSHGVTERACKKGLFTLQTWNPRDFTRDVHKTVDDRPYGGGPGMVMLYQPLADTVAAIRADSSRRGKLVYLSPQGRPLTQSVIQQFAEEQHLILLAGRYEGIDERFIEDYVDEEWSIGDYVLSGGEIPAMVLIDAIARLLPGALGHPESANQDSFMSGLLDCPHYTRPEVVNHKAVPAAKYPAASRTATSSL